MCETMNRLKEEACKALASGNIIAYQRGHGKVMAHSGYECRTCMKEQARRNAARAKAPTQTLNDLTRPNPTETESLNTLLAAPKPQCVQPVTRK